MIPQKGILEKAAVRKERQQSMTAGEEKWGEVGHRAGWIPKWGMLGCQRLEKPELFSDFSLRCAGYRPPSFSLQYSLRMERFIYFK